MAEISGENWFLDRGYRIVVVRDLPKVEARVQFSLPAPELDFPIFDRRTQVRKSEQNFSVVWQALASDGGSCFPYSRIFDKVSSSAVLNILIFILIINSTY